MYTSEPFLIAMLIIFMVPFQRILRYASVDDIAIWGVLALILLDGQRVGKQFAFLLVFALARMAMRAQVARIAERQRWYVGLIWLAACGLGAEWAGLHFIVGAFIAGAVMDANWFDRQHLDSLRLLTRRRSRP